LAAVEPAHQAGASANAKHHEEDTMSNLTRWDPFRDILNLQDRLTRSLYDPFPRLGATESVGGWFPLVDIHDDADRLILRAEVPGIPQEEIEVQVEGGTLTIRGEKKQEMETDTDGVHRTERFYGSFSRSFVLPATVDAARVSATCRNGILEVILPKAEEAKPRKIAIKAA
jgi:HSP20 family protein